MTYHITTNNTTTAGTLYYTSTGTGTGTWTSPVYTIAAEDTQGNQLHVRGDANFEGDVKIKGKSLVDSLERVEERLAILRPNEELEQKWEQLRELRKMYMELEAEIIEKEKVWAILKR